MSDGIYSPLDVEPDIEWADRLEQSVARNLLIADNLAETAIRLAKSDPVSARECIDFAKRRLERINQLLQ